MSGFNIAKAYASIVIETTRGVVIANSSVQTNIRLNPRTIKFDADIQSVAMQYASGGYTAAARVMTNRVAPISFEYPMQPGAAIGVAPNARKLWLCSGNKEVITLTVSTDLITANSTVVTLTVGGSPTSTTATVYASSHAATMAQIAVKVAALTGVSTCTVTGDNLIITTNSITGGGLPLIFNAVTTLGASQPTWSTPTVGYYDDETKDEVSASMYLTLIPVSGNVVVFCVKGVVGSTSYSMPSPGMPITMSFKGQGAFSLVDDEALTYVPTGLNTSQIPSTIGSTFAFAGESSAQCLSWEFDTARKLDYEYKNSDPTGVLAGRVTEGFEPPVKFKVYSKLGATEDYWTRYAAGTVHTASVTTAVSGIRNWIFTWNKFQINKIGQSSSEGYNTYDIEGLALKDVGENAYSIVQN